MKPILLVAHIDIKNEIETLTNSFEVKVDKDKSLQFSHGFLPALNMYCNIQIDGKYVELNIISDLK